MSLIFGSFHLKAVTTQTNALKEKDRLLKSSLGKKDESAVSGDVKEKKNLILRNH